MSKQAIEDVTRAALELIGDNHDVRVAVIAAFDTYEEALDDAQEQHETESEDAEDTESFIEEAAHRVCDAVERPVGKLTFNVPRPEEFASAVHGLHDAIGRRI